MSVPHRPDQVDTSGIPDRPAQSLPFEVEPEFDQPPAEPWTFAPKYYPDRFPQTKDKDLSRSGKQCGGEDVSIKAVKNREYHVAGIVLAPLVPVFNDLLDHEGVVTLYSPIAPSRGMECYVKAGEIDANPSGWDPIEGKWQFEYTLDLVSTGADEYDHGHNAIVSAIMRPGGLPDNIR